MGKTDGKGRALPWLFLLGALGGTAGALLSPAPIYLSEIPMGEMSLSSALLRGLVPLLPALFIGRALFPLAVLLRACTVSWTLTLLLRAGQLRSMVFFCVSLLFLLPAFFLLAEEGSRGASAVSPMGAKRESRHRGLLFLLFWLLGSAARFFLPCLL